MPATYPIIVIGEHALCALYTLLTNVKDAAPLNKTKKAPKKIGAFFIESRGYIFMASSSNPLSDKTITAALKEAKPSKSTASEEGVSMTFKEFIEKPTSHCTRDDYKAGEKLVLAALEINPLTIITTINDLSKEEYGSPAIYLFDDLVAKMRTMGSAEKLNVLFDKHLDMITKSFIWNSSDLKRCLSVRSL